VDIVLFSDYDKGMAIPSITQVLLDAAHKAGKLVIANAKPGNIKQFKTAYLVSVNESEAQAASGVLIKTEKDVVRAAKRLVSTRYGGPEALVVTRGPKGMTLFTLAGGAVTVPGHPIEVYDATGAGDTVASVLALAVAAGATLDEAAVLANCAGGAVVQKVGVATVTRDEILAMMEQETANPEA
jgi:D-beta-D-heptose 7-phosphate kinase/D-beta-D-heptose 1-phosphate adenosyltransferase